MLAPWGVGTVSHMVARPSGTVTFLFTDMEGSTRRWEAETEAMRADVARHDELVRDAVEGHRGIVFAAGGDGFAVAFARAGDALDCAISVQRALREAGLPNVRIGVHTGEADERDGNYFGPSVNRTARLMAIGHGGQILVSHATERLVRETLGEGVTLLELGEHRLRDLSRPERVFQLRAPGLADQFPPLVSLDAFPGNLPLQVSSFIGRERELARVAAALADARVVTLTGVGGVGKTRLALQAAAELLPEFREGAWLVELAPIRDPDAVSGAFASVFGVTARAGRTFEDTLIEFLGSKQLLLVVDNCEHLLEAAADLIDLIERSCAGVKVLATSREGLALEGERVVPVPSLSEPAADADLSATGRSDAVRLFVERALAVDPDFVLGADNAVAVAQVCRRLDGIPLAIELAAARVGAMNPTELARGLDHRFETLSGGRRRAVQRHQTLRAAIDWSYDLCSEPERRLLARLSVFAGGCTRAAAEAVCSGEPIEPRTTFELLAALVARSLVVAERDRPETRYRLLETLREYGEERLAEHRETEALRTRHAEYYSELALSIRDEITGPGQIGAGERLLAEQENLLAAIDHAVDTDNADLALRIVYNVPGPQLQIGYPLVLPVEPILALTGATDHPLYPFAMAIGANQAALRGDAVAADALGTRSLEAAHRLGDPNRFVEAMACLRRQTFASGRGDTHEAARQSEQVAEIARAAGRPESLAIALGSAAMYHAMAGEHEAALDLATEGLAVARALGAPGSIALNLMSLAAALVEQDPVRARALLHEGLELRTTLNYESPGDATQATLISAQLEDWPQALALAEHAIRTAHWLSHWALVAAIVNVVARALADAAPERAAILQGIALGLLPARPAPGIDAGGNDASTTSNNATTSQRGRGTDFVTELRRATTALLRDTLPEQQLEDLRTQGRRMERDDAIAYALDAIAQSIEPTSIAQ